MAVTTQPKPTPQITLAEECISLGGRVAAKLCVGARTGMRMPVCVGEKEEGFAWARMARLALLASVMAVTKMYPDCELFCRGACGVDPALDPACPAVARAGWTLSESSPALQ